MSSPTFKIIAQRRPGAVAVNQYIDEEGNPLGAVARLTPGTTRPELVITKPISLAGAGLIIRELTTATPLPPAATKLEPCMRKPDSERTVLRSQP